MNKFIFALIILAIAMVSFIGQHFISKYFVIVSMSLGLFILSYSFFIARDLKFGISRQLILLGLSISFIGLILNAVVVISNDFQMPVIVPEDQADLLGPTIMHSINPSNVKFISLGDHISFFYSYASPGDILMFFGILIIFNLILFNLIVAGITKLFKRPKPLNSN